MLEECRFELDWRNPLNSFLRLILEEIFFFENDLVNEKFGGFLLKNR